MKIVFGIHEEGLHVFSIMSGFPGVSSTEFYLVSCPCSMFHDNLSEGVMFLDREYYTFRLFLISSSWLIRLLRCDWALLCKIKWLVMPAKDAGGVNVGSFCHNCRRVMLSRIPCVSSAYHSRALTGLFLAGFLIMCVIGKDSLALQRQKEKTGKGFNVINFTSWSLGRKYFYEVIFGVKAESKHF